MTKPASQDNVQRTLYIIIHIQKHKISTVTVQFPVMGICQISSLLTGVPSGLWPDGTMRAYHRAAQLRALVCWCNPKYTSQWKDIETAQTVKLIIPLIP